MSGENENKTDVVNENDDDKPTKSTNSNQQRDVQVITRQEEDNVLYLETYPTLAEKLDFYKPFKI